MKNYLIGARLILLAGLANVNCEVEICTSGAKHVFQITQESCPFGVFFSEPQAADCFIYTGEDESSILADVCSRASYSPKRKQFQYIPEISTEAIPLGTSCKAKLNRTCNRPVHRITADSFIRPITPLALTYASESGDGNKDVVGAQTQRMFEYTMGLAKVYVDETHRIVLLLKKTFGILRKFCGSKFMPSGFMEDVESSFLFLRDEADSTNFKDISAEEYERIMEHLVFCAEQRNPFKFSGKHCATYSVIQRVNKSGEMFADFDRSNEDAFLKYDVPVEATWGAVDFVHGLCYGTFRDHINMHHLYQQAMERLFTPEILYRWKNRFVFEGQQNIWNNFFSTNVNLALVNLDMCIQASYVSTPFLHRLERPIDLKVPATSRRKRRWAEAHAFRSLDSVQGYCFQTKEDADAILNKACE